MTIPKAKSRAHQAYSNSSNQQESYAWGRKTQGTKQRYTKNSTRPSQGTNKSRPDTNSSDSQGYTPASEQTRNNARKRGNLENNQWSRSNSKFGNNYGGNGYGGSNFGGSKNPEPRSTIWQDQKHGLTSHALRKANANQGRKGGFTSNGSDAYPRKDMGANGAIYKGRLPKRPLNKPQKPNYSVDNGSEIEASESEREMIRRFKALMNPSAANKTEASENTLSSYTNSVTPTESIEQVAQTNQDSQANPLDQFEQTSQALDATQSNQSACNVQRAQNTSQTASADEKVSQNSEFNQQSSSKADRTKIPLSSNIPFTQTITVTGQGSLSSDSYLYDNEFSSKKQDNKTTEVKVTVKRRRVFQRVDNLSADDKHPLYETVTTTQTLDDEGQPIQISQAVIHNPASVATTHEQANKPVQIESGQNDELGVREKEPQTERTSNTYDYSDPEQNQLFAYGQNPRSQEVNSEFVLEHSTLNQTEQTQQESQDNSQQSLAAKIKRLGKAAARLSALESAASNDALNLTSLAVLATASEERGLDVTASDSAIENQVTALSSSQQESSDAATLNQDASLEVVSLGSGSHFLETTTLQTAAAPVSIKIKRRTKAAVADKSTQVVQDTKTEQDPKLEHKAEQNTQAESSTKVTSKAKLAKSTKKQSASSTLSAHTSTASSTQSDIAPSISLEEEALSAAQSPKSKPRSKKSQVKSSTKQLMTQETNNHEEHDASNEALNVVSENASNVALDNVEGIAAEQAFAQKVKVAADFKSSVGLDDTQSCEDSESILGADILDGAKLKHKAISASIKRRTKFTNTKDSTSAVSTTSDLQLTATSDKKDDVELVSPKSKARKSRSAAKTRSSSASNETDLALSDIHAIESNILERLYSDSTLSTAVLADQVSKIDAAEDSLASSLQTATKKQTRKTTGKSTKAAKDQNTCETLFTQSTSHTAEQIETTALTHGVIASKASSTKRQTRAQNKSLTPVVKTSGAVTSASLDSDLNSNVAIPEPNESAQKLALEKSAPTPSQNTKRRAKSTNAKVKKVKSAKDDNASLTMEAAAGLSLYDYGSEKIGSSLKAESSESEAADGLILTPVITTSQNTSLQSVKPHPKKLRLLKQDQSLSENALLSTSAKIKAMSKPYVLID